MNAVTKVSSDTTTVRASLTSSWPDCERRCALDLIPDEIAAAGFVIGEKRCGIGAAVGTSVHCGASTMLEEKMRTGELPPASVSTDAAIDALRAETADGVVFDGKTTVDMNEAEAQVLRMTSVYRRDVAPQVTSVLVEERFEAFIPWSRQKLLVSGQTDLLAREPDALDDLKTGVKMRNHNPQLGTYSLILRSHGHSVKRTRVTFIQRVHITPKTKVQVQPGAVTLDHDISKVETAAVNVLRRIDTTLTTFREGDPDRHLLPGDPWAFMANPSSMLCSGNWCRAHGGKGDHAWCKEWLEKDTGEGE